MPRLAQLESRTGGSKTSPAIEDELRILSELEAVAASWKWEPGSVSREAVVRGRPYLKSQNLPLVFLAATAISRNGESTVDEQTAKLAQVPNCTRECKAKLYWSLVMSGSEPAIAQAVAGYAEDPSLLSSVDEQDLLKAIEAGPNSWKPMLPQLLPRFTQPSSSADLLQLLCRLKEPAMKGDAERLASTEPLKNDPELVVRTIVGAAWKDAFSVATKALESNPMLGTEGLTTNDLDACVSLDGEFAGCSPVTFSQMARPTK